MSLLPPVNGQINKNSSSHTIPSSRLVVVFHFCVCLLCLLIFCFSLNFALFNVFYLPPCQATINPLPLPHPSTLWMDKSMKVGCCFFCMFCLHSSSLTIFFSFWHVVASFSSFHHCFIPHNHSFHATNSSSYIKQLSRLVVVFHFLCLNYKCNISTNPINWSPYISNPQCFVGKVCFLLCFYFFLMSFLLSPVSHSITNPIFVCLYHSLWFLYFPVVFFLGLVQAALGYSFMLWSNPSQLFFSHLTIFTCCLAMTQIRDQI